MKPKLQGNTSVLSQSQASDASHDLSCLWKQYHLGNSYTLQNSSTTQGTALASTLLNHSFCILILKKHFPKGLASMTLVS